MSTVAEPVEKERAESKWLSRLYACLENYEASDPRPFGPFAVALCVYAFLVFIFSNRPLWHDELYTYYIAKAPTLKQFMVEATRIDLQPPIQYILSRISLALVGDSDTATRLPSMIAFTVASICLYYFVRRRLGRFYGLLATLVFWLTPFFRYATEARPYALVAGFLGVALLGWQAAIEGKRRRLGLLALGFGVWGMIVSQAFSPLIVTVLGVAEVVRSLDQRKIDWPVWVALLAPCPFVVVYAPILHNFGGWTSLPPEFQASASKIIVFYADLLSAVGAALLIALVLALAASHAQAPLTQPSAFTAKKHEIALVLGLLSLPIVINLLLMRSGGAFWPRYSIPTGIGLSLLFVYVMAKFTNWSRAAAAIAAICVFVGIITGIVVQIAEAQGRTTVKQLSLNQLPPQSALVDASGLTFLEMNKREKADLLSRVFYLTDHDAAVHYAHATIFENTAKLREYWPIQGTVMPYAEFVRQTPHFFVLGTPDYPEDWLIPKLLDDGAELQFKGEILGSYKDHMIFEVTMPAANGLEAPK